MARVACFSTRTSVILETISSLYLREATQATSFEDFAWQRNTYSSDVYRLAGLTDGALSEPGPHARSGTSAGQMAPGPGAVGRGLWQGGGVGDRRLTGCLYRVNQAARISPGARGAPPSGHVTGGCRGDGGNNSDV